MKRFIPQSRTWNGMGCGLTLRFLSPFYFHPHFPAICFSRQASTQKVLEPKENTLAERPGGNWDQAAKGRDAIGYPLSH
jgi:hypothetical protein